jgi:S-(hydroxymethyl)glutathione dehydrogenase/alcohol dehydrogenase
MRAAVLNSIDEKIVIRDDVEALGPGPGEVRVAVRAAGVCHSDLSARGGGLPQPVPAILGHEAAGEVIAAGEGAGFEVGDRVIASWLPPCATCNSCLRGEPWLCMTHVMTAYMVPRFQTGDGMAFGMAGVGAFAQELVIPAAAAIRIADDVPFEVAALVGCGVMTGVGAVVNTAKVPPGASVAVIGCGGVGISAIQGARVSGAAVIAAVDTVEAKHEVALGFGATHACHPDRLAELVRSETGGEGFDYVFEVVGVPQTIRTAWSAARRGGTVVIVGAGRSDHHVEFTPFELLFEAKTLLPSLYGSADIRRDCTTVLNLWRAGRLDLEGMITQRLKLDAGEEALGALGRGDVVRQVILHE